MRRGFQDSVVLMDQTMRDPEMSPPVNVLLKTLNGELMRYLLDLKGMWYFSDLIHACYSMQNQYIHRLKHECFK